MCKIYKKEIKVSEDKEVIGAWSCRAGLCTFQQSKCNAQDKKAGTNLFLHDCPFIDP